MSDYISREEILKEKWTLENPDGSSEEVVSALDIKMIPSADVRENIHGEWIAYDHGMGFVYLKCPFCGMTIDKRYVEHNFCGRCGSKLSGEKLVLLR